MNRENRSEQIRPEDLEKRSEELDARLIEASTRGKQKEVDKVLDETLEISEERRLLEEADRLNKKRILN